MLATPASALPSGPAWTYEVKWEGYRTLALKDGARVRLLSRNLKYGTRQYPTIARAVSSLAADSVLLDGGALAVDDQGRPSFQALHHGAAHTIVYRAFDLLHLGEQSLVDRPLGECRERLAEVFVGSRIWRSEALPGTPEHIEQAVR
jgi:bifunctional non-homologous end joining protein LigD